MNVFDVFDALKATFDRFVNGVRRRGRETLISQFTQMRKTSPEADLKLPFVTLRESMNKIHF